MRFTHNTMGASIDQATLLQIPIFLTARSRRNARPRFYRARIALLKGLTSERAHQFEPSCGKPGGQ
jgi:hypothetical protein